MTNVIIVSRTRMGEGVCVGGFDQIGLRNVRLLPGEGIYRQPADCPYQIGQLWQMELAAPKRVEAPHIEDVIVRDCRMKVASVDFMALIRNAGQPVAGMASALFCGFLTLSAGRKARILHQHVPGASVAFWIPGYDLTSDPSEERRLLVPWADGLLGPDRISVKYVGDTEPPDKIPAGSVVRVSLSRWLAPKDGDPEGCWLQISGWYRGSRRAVEGAPPRKPAAPASPLRQPSASPVPEPGKPASEVSAPREPQKPAPEASPLPQVKGSFKSFSELQRAIEGSTEASAHESTTGKSKSREKPAPTPPKRGSTAGASKSGTRSPIERGQIRRLVAAAARMRAAGEPVPSSFAEQIAKLRANRSALATQATQPLPRRRSPKARVWTERMALEAVKEVARQRERDAKVGDTDRVSKFPPAPDDWRDQD